MGTLSALLFAIFVWVHGARGEIRCYCNDASCVRTGYMCKSAVGKCFTQLTFDESDASKSSHGCVDFLPPADRQVCEGQGDIIKTRNGPQEWPILMCCKDDMCNYMNFDINNISPVNTKSNGSNLKDQGTNKRNNHRKHNYSRDHNHQYIDDSNASQQRELWFKAAVIAVPIAGGFILILLVLLAVRMLRSDSRRHRHLMQMRRDRSLFKAKLYVADHFSDKYLRNAHMNSIENCKQNTIYKDVNIKIDYDGHAYEKISDSSTHGGSCNSIVVWGKQKTNSCSADV